MVDIDQLKESYDHAALSVIAEAFHLLHFYGVFIAMERQNKVNFVERFHDKSPDELALDVLGVQRANRLLIDLHDFAGSIKEGINNEQA